MLKEKGRAYATIDLDALRNNLVEINQLINENTKIMAVIKADGYGHGAVAIGKELEQMDFIWGYATASIEEAVILRKNGLVKPILILGAVFKEQYELLYFYNLIPTVFSYEMAEELSNKMKLVKKDLKVHIKIDTGMNRIGFLVNEKSIKEVEQISRLPHIIMEGIFTHFVSADEIDKTKTKYQMEQFLTICEKLEVRGISFPLKHASNSAGIIDVKEARFDLVRAGIGMYGIWPSDEVNKNTLKLKPVMTLKSRVVFIKTLPKGSTISYGATYEIKKESKIATISLGYADGYPRSLSNKGYVLLHGIKAPICGRICMDQFMIDVTHIDSACVGDYVTLIGTDGNESITIEDISKISERFYYEIPCIISKRVPRIYIKNKEEVQEKILANDYFEN